MRGRAERIYSLHPIPFGETNSHRCFHPTSCALGMSDTPKSSYARFFHSYGPDWNSSFELGKGFLHDGDRMAMTSDSAGVRWSDQLPTSPQVMSPRRHSPQHGERSTSAGEIKRAPRSPTLPKDPNETNNHHVESQSTQSISHTSRHGYQNQVSPLYHKSDPKH